MFYRDDRLSLRAAIRQLSQAMKAGHVGRAQARALLGEYAYVWDWSAAYVREQQEGYGGHAALSGDALAMLDKIALAARMWGRDAWSKVGQNGYARAAERAAEDVWAYWENLADQDKASFTVDAAQHELPKLRRPVRLRLEQTEVAANDLCLMLMGKRLNALTGKNAAQIARKQARRREAVAVAQGRFKALREFCKR